LAHELIHGLRISYSRTVSPFVIVREPIVSSSASYITGVTLRRERCLPSCSETFSLLSIPSDFFIDVDPCKFTEANANEIKPKKVRKLLSTRFKTFLQPTRATLVVH
jgi:hypothetical protein